MSYSHRTPSTSETGTDTPVFFVDNDVPVRDDGDGAQHRELDEHQLRQMLVEFMIKHRHKASLFPALTSILHIS